MEIEQRLAEVLSLLFNKKILPEDKISMDSEELWDSLKHIEVIMTLEEEFDISINPQDIQKLTSFKAIAEIIKELQNA